MLMPKKVKHRKQQRGRIGGSAKGGVTVNFGDYGIQALEAGWITARQIEAARIAMTRHVRRGGKVWIYKGDILPYKLSSEDKISREAAMAVGETSGQGRPRRIISAGGGRRRPEQGEPGTAPPTAAPAAEAPAEPGETGVSEEAAGDETADAADAAATAGTAEPADVEGGDTAEAKPIIREVDPDIERLLAEEEEIERRTREHHEAPHFRDY